MPSRKSTTKKSKFKRGATPDPDHKPSTNVVSPALPDARLIASSEASLPGLKSSPEEPSKTSRPVRKSSPEASSKTSRLVRKSSPEASSKTSRPVRISSPEAPSKTSSHVRISSPEASSKTSRPVRISSPEASSKTSRPVRISSPEASPKTSRPVQKSRSDATWMHSIPAVKSPPDITKKSTLKFPLVPPSDSAGASTYCSTKDPSDNFDKNVLEHTRKDTSGSTPKTTSKHASKTTSRKSSLDVTDRALIASMDRAGRIVGLARGGETQSSDREALFAPNLEEIKNCFEQNVCAERYKEILSYFTSEKSERDLFTYLWDLKESRRYLYATPVIAKKNAEDAETFRVSGNTQYRLKNFDKALELYNIAIMAAPHPHIPTTLIPRLRNRLEIVTGIMRARGESEFDVTEGGTWKYKVLAMSYSNRSAVLFAQQQYEKCLSDINFAIMYGLPEMMQSKLEDRRKKCAEALSINKPGDLSLQAEGNLTFEDLVERFDQCQITSEVRLVSDLLLSPCKRGNVRAASDPSKSPSSQKIESSNEEFPNLSSAVTVSYTPDKGRHLVAVRAIRPGEVLATDSSYASALYFGNLNLHCSSCFGRCYTIQPCSNCTRVVFCSVDCWVTGMTGDHLNECKCLPSLAALQRDTNEYLLPSLAFKMLMNLGHDSMRQVLPSLEMETRFFPIRKVFYKEGKYPEFRNVYHLVTNREHFSSDELFSKCVTAVVLIKLLEGSERYYVDMNGEILQPSDEELIDTGSVLLRLLLNLSCNAYEIAKWQTHEETSRLQGKPLGAGVFPTLSLANHACDPTARHYFAGKRMILRANTFIPAGVEITNDYCGNYYAKPIKERRMELTKYFINCKCDACVGKWPIYNRLPQNIHISCIQCGSGVSLVPAKPRCRNCRTEFKEKNQIQAAWWRTAKHLKLAKERYDHVVLKLSLNPDMSLEDMYAVTNYLEVLKKSAHLPLQENCFAQETLFKMYFLGY